MKRLVIVTLAALMMLGLMGCSKTEIINDTPHFVQEQVVRATTMIDEIEKLSKRTSISTEYVKAQRKDLSKIYKYALPEKIKSTIRDTGSRIRRDIIDVVRETKDIRAPYRNVKY